MSLVYVALGSNLEVPEHQLDKALEAIQAIQTTSGFKVSPWYKTKSIGGPKDQPDYVNAVCKFDTQMPPVDLLNELQNIENSAGRVRMVRWGPRTLDLDIIWFENNQITSEILTIPHPRAHLRAFVLQPLVDLSAEFALQHQSLDYWLKTVTDQSIEFLR